MDRISTGEPEGTPWLQREDWARGVLKDQHRRQSLAVTWFFVVFFALVLLPAGFVLHQKLVASASAPVWLAFGPPALAALLLLRAFWLTAFGRRFRTTLDLETRPGVLGGFLRGTVHTDAPLDGATEIRYVLSCQLSKQSTRGSRPDTSIDAHWDVLLHREEGVLPVDTLRRTGAGLAIPVEVGIPYTCPEATVPGQKPVIQWFLEVVVQRPRDRLEATFEVPVFRTPASDPTYLASTTQDRTERVKASIYDASPSHAGVRVEHTPSGASFYFGPARMTGTATGLSLFSLALCGATAALYLSGVNRIWVALAAFVSACCLWGAARCWLSTSSIRIEAGLLRFRTGILGLGLPRQVPLVDVASVRAERVGGKGERTTVYQLVLVLTSQKLIPVAQYLPDQTHADWLAQQMVRAVERFR